MENRVAVNNSWNNGNGENSNVTRGQTVAEQTQPIHIG